jgi:hypothetical protein
MAKCPKCRLSLHTPWFFDLQGWAELQCPHCLAQLRMKPRPVVPLFIPVLLSTLALSRYGHKFAVSAEILLIASTIALVFMLTANIPVALRKAAPSEPSIRLNLDKNPNRPN